MNVVAPAPSPRHRDPHIDAVRCLAIVLVVLGHAITVTSGFDHAGPGLVSVGPGLWISAALAADPFLTILYSIHMPLFAFVSGLVLWRAVPDSFRTQLTKRSRGLLVPYVSWFVVTYLLAFAAGRAPLSGMLGELSSIALNPANHYALWYLHALFLASMMLAAIATAAPGRRWAITTSAVIAVVLISPAGARDGIGPALGNALFIYPYLVAGYLAATARSGIVLRRGRLVSLGAAALVLLSLLAVFPNQTDLGFIPFAGPATRALLVWASTVMFSVGLLALYSFIHGVTLTLQAAIGRRSLGIYATHSIIQIGLIELLGLRSVPLVLAVSLASGLAAVMLIERLPLVRTALLGIAWRPTMNPIDGRRATEGNAT